MDRIGRQNRITLLDAVYESLCKHLSPESAEETWLLLQGGIDDADSVDDVERAIERRFAAEDACGALVWADVRPVAERLMD